MVRTTPTLGGGRTAITNRSAADPFRHVALLYHDRVDFLSGTVPFIQRALAANHPTLVAVLPNNLHEIQSELGPDADRVTFADMTVAGRNPGRILPSVLLRFANQHAGRSVAIIGEPIWAGRSAVEYPACAIHEALINVAFAGRAAMILCPYDIGRLDWRAIHDAHRTHPVIAADRDVWPSPGWGDPAAVAESFNQPLPEPPPSAAQVKFDAVTGLAAIRRFVIEHTSAAGLSGETVANLVTAVNELATNTLRYTDDIGTVSIWADADTVVCQVEDSGYLTEPLAGRIPVSPTMPGGRGLLIVHELCELVRTYSRPGRTTTQLYATF